MATGSKVQPPISPITYSKYERMLDTIRYGKDEEAIKLFSSGQFDVNLEVPYLFEDGKKYQVTPLHWAVKYHKTKLCKFLLASGANPYKTLVYEYYPLHEACNRGYEDIVRVFIDAMVDINRVTNDLDTPLHIACTRGNIQCVHLLLGSGADAKMKNKAGHTPLEAALYHNHQDLVQLFKTYGITFDPAISTAAAVATNDKQKVQRRHSFSQIQPRNPKKSLSSSLTKLTNARPHSFYMDSDNPSTSEMVTTTSNGGSLNLLTPNRPPSSSQSTLPHTSPLTAPSPGLSPSSTAQAHTCFGTMASSAGSVPLYNTTSSFNSTSVSPASSRPTLMTQLSIASACTADSPSPVERDGIGGAKNWTNVSRMGTHTVSPLYSNQERLSNGYCDARTKTASLVASEQPTILSESIDDSNNIGVKIKPTQSGLNDQFGCGKHPLKDVEAHRTQLERLRNSSTFLQQKKYTQQTQHQPQQNSRRLPPVFVESLSNPEFPLTNHYSLKTTTERARSYGDLYTSSTSNSGSTGRRDVQTTPIDVKPKLCLETADSISPSREKLNTISQYVCTSLEQNWCGKMMMTSSLSCSDNGSESMVGIKLNPVYDIVQKILNDLATAYSLSQEQIQAVIDSVSSNPTLHVTQEQEPSSSMNSSLCVLSLSESTVYESCREGLADVGYIMDECPYDVQLESEGFMALYFRVWRRIDDSMSKQVDIVGQRCDSDGVHLKVIVKLFNLKNKDESSQYHCLVPGTSSCETVPSFQYVAQPQADEVPVLKQLSYSPHPNLVQLVSQFKANVGDQYDTFAHNLDPANPKAMYSTAPTGEFLLLRSSNLKLSTYFEDLHRRHNHCIPEAVVLHTLAQLLLAVTNLLRNDIVHCSIKPENVFVDVNDRSTVLLANFSHSIQLSSQKLNIESVRRIQQRLRYSNHSALAPEVIQTVKSRKLEGFFSQGTLQTLFSTNDSYVVGCMMYKLLLGESHEFVQDLSSNCYTYDQIPNLNNLSPQCNHVLRKLIAYDPQERLSALEGAMACLVLLFGPRPSQVGTLEDCHQWLLAETMEFYMRPVLADDKSSSTCRTGMNSTDWYSKLLCMYLIIAGVNPRRVLTANRFLQQCSK